MSKNKTKEKNENKLLKIITLGDSGVGKTCILRRFVTGKFDKNTLSMIGFETSSKEIVLKDGTKVTLQLIDTAGQENYHALATTYIRNSDGVLFVFSHDSQESFNNINNLKNEHNFYGYADTRAKDGIGIDDVFSGMGELLVRIKGKKEKKQNAIIINQYKRKKRLFC